MSSLVISTEHHKTFYIVAAVLVIIIIMLILFRKCGVGLRSKLGISQNVTAESECNEIKCVDITSCRLNYCPNYYPIRTYSLEELKIATKDFKILLGSGATSDVYLAEFGDGKFAAVKRLIEKKGGTLKFFFDEVSVMLRISHPNLIGLLGFCLEKGEQLLLLEYIQHKSLFDKMHTRNGQQSGVLSWSNRISIALDVARALEYLHSMADPPIIHRDVKSSNILLISNDHAKLADFGLCKLGNDIQSALTPTTVKGSLGYVDTYYLETGLVSPKSDVYSFGVLLLELITGLRSVQGSTTLVEWTEDCRKNKNVDKWIGLLDPKFKGDVNLEQLKILVDLANQTLLAHCEERPEMSQIVYRLSSCLVSLPESDLHV